ncbi:hypothetical protein AOLI_G00259330 [Acnodon oligacanthus]
MVTIKLIPNTSDINPNGSIGLFFSSAVIQAVLMRKLLIVEKLADSGFFTVVVMGARCCHDYNTNTVILFTIQIHRGAYTSPLSLYVIAKPIFVVF